MMKTFKRTLAKLAGWRGFDVLATRDALKGALWLLWGLDALVVGLLVFVVAAEPPGGWFRG